jgi:hypothetical protein
LAAQRFDLVMMLPPFVRNHRQLKTMAWQVSWQISSACSSIKASMKKLRVLSLCGWLSMPLLTGCATCRQTQPTYYGEEPTTKEWHDLDWVAVAANLLSNLTR